MLTARDRIAALPRRDNLAPISAEASAAIAAMTARPSASIRNGIAALIGGLVRGGLWTKIEWLSLFTVHTEQAALLNLKSPGASLTKFGAPAFTALGGWIGSASDGLDGPAFSTCTLYSRDSAHLLAAAGGDGAANAAGEAGLYGPADYSYIVARTAGDQFVIKMHHASTAVAANSNGSGLYIANRSDSSAISLYKIGQAPVSTSIASTAPAGTGTFYSAYTSRPAWAFGYGSSLTDADAALYGRLLQSFFATVRAR